MSSRCNDLQRRLTLEGARSLADDESAQEHLATCGECFSILERLDELDSALARLPAVEPPKVLLDQLLERVATEPFDSAQERPSWRHRALRFFEPLGRPKVRWGLAAALVMGLGTVLLKPALRQPIPFETRQDKVPQVRFVVPSPTAEKPAPSDSSTLDAKNVQKLRALRYKGTKDDNEATAQSSLQDLGAAGLGSGEDSREGDSIVVRAESPIVDSDERAFTGSIQGSMLEKKLPERRRARPKKRKGQRKPPPMPIIRRAPIPTPAQKFDLSEGRLARRFESRDAELSADLREDGRLGANAAIGGLLATNEKAVVKEEVTLISSGQAAGTDITPTGADRQEAAASEPETNGTGFFAEVDGVSLTPAEDSAETARAEGFLAERQRVEGLAFREATGYWRTTYVPGDRRLRWLSSRLLASRLDESRPHPQSDALALLHNAVRRPVQPFDPPHGAALALALSADRRAVAGETRLLLQVGLQATGRRAGRRPPLDLALVLDLSEELPENARAQFRALVLAMSAARQPHDRFRLIVAGQPGSTMVKPEAFRFGPLQVALDQLFGVGGSTEPTLDLPEALDAALEVLQGESQPGSPLGSSTILLATARTYGGELPTLEGLAHAAAVASVPLSTIGLGDGIDGEELERLAIAGQGSRRLLTSATAASQLVDRELAAASRAVARAVRLSIRLAPGVRLVDVVGSESLDDLAAQRVRDAEQSVDLKIARSLGIAADRGEDEEGIQIVIPAFFAGDAHVILLDLVVPGPGPVADVSLRFKDLVQSRNGVAAAHLGLPRGVRARGPLELNVLHNLLVLQLVETLDRAGDAAAAGRRNDAVEDLEGHLSLLRGLGELLPGFDVSREVMADRTLLEGYISVLASGDASPETLQRLSDSLRYAARLKVLPAPERAESRPGGSLARP